MLRGSILKYEPHQMEEALQAVKDGMSIKQAAERHGVPRNTLSDKVKGKTPIGRKMGPESWLKKEEESMLVQWALSLCKAGFPITIDDLQNSVQQLSKELRRPFPFKDGRPGRKWCTSFLKRNPGLTLRTAQNLTSSRAAVSQEQISAWFREVYKYLEENKLEDVLSDPRRIFNGDESAFFLNPKGNKVLAKKGDKNIFQQVNSDEKECITVLLTGNAAGELCPPLLCLKYERLPQDIVAGIPSEWGIGKSPNGWMTGEVFYEFLTNIFHPWLVKKEITLPAIIFIDGHSSHLTLNSSTFCKDHGIVLVALLPNSTHILQPMDVGVFKPLKSAWKNVVHEWRLQRVAHKEDPTLKKKDFAKLLDTVIAKVVTPEILQHSFRKSGIFPWDPSAVDEDKFVSRPSSVPCTPASTLSSPTPKTPESNIGSSRVVEHLEKFLGHNKLKLFNESGDVWQGDVRDTSIFEYWRHVRNYDKVETSSSVQHEEPHPQIEEPTVPEKPSNPPTAVEEELPIIEDTISSINPEPTPSTSKDLTAVPTDKSIPSPFKRALFWPSQKTKLKKRAPREKIPSVASSSAWQDYFSKKEKAKIDLQKQKEERAAERLRKRLEKEKQTAKKRKVDDNSTSSSSEEEIIPMESSDEWSGEHEEEECVELEEVTDENLRPGSFVLVTFMGGKRGATKYRFVCIIQETEGEEVRVMGMRAQDESKKVFVTKENDVSYVSRSQINGILPSPSMNQQGARVNYIFSASVDVNEN
ncbi:uncharacterized protein LOC134527237 [Bacillus rossius redtenbacheri]|uniref:uncharacterized protein LOC134527237 n=1 Tax=Bacillus rossius redtenbacheri TaxID=93214 RepID=UPI002FDED606